MYFNKYPHRANFSFAPSVDLATGQFSAGSREFQLHLRAFEGDIYQLQVRSAEAWPDGNLALIPLETPAPSDRRRLKVSDGFDIELLGKNGQRLLHAASSEGFGVSGVASLFQFSVPDGSRFYGMGEKTFGEIELSGIRTKFSNTDVWADFHYRQWLDQAVDPTYFTTPYVIVKSGEEYIGLLLHNPSPAFIETPGRDDTSAFVEFHRTARHMILGTEGGEPNLWVIYGPSLPELTAKLQSLVGHTPLPPIWSLGYQQSRWGYRGHDDLIAVDAEFAKHQIPCDGLWMDLEHMDGYRIFNTSREAFPDGPQATAEVLAKNGRRIVPILDPGVKSEPGLAVYDDGLEKGVFCQNVEGKPFVGLVWPGETVFPDFTLPEAREWWAEYTKNWFREGFGATWVDMNDVATGAVDPTGMRFRYGSLPHDAHRNQYALGMQMATWDGFQRAKPDERPFMVSRSGFVSSSRYGAIWSGDNFSNYFHLRTSIPTAIGMSLSGLPFNGADIGGFGGDCSETLMIDWVKAAFLFPFFRNHSNNQSTRQEPYVYSPAGLQTIRRYIRLRYKLLPYLYNLFNRQEESGTPILRPVLYHYDEPATERLSDAFMIGEFILQAPFVQEEAKTRPVILPGGEPWYDARTGTWVVPGEITVRNLRSETPLFVAAGAILPMQKGTPTNNDKELRDVNFHVFVPEDWSGETSVVYHADDGISFDYRSGGRSTLAIRLVAAEGHLAISTDHQAHGFGDIKPTFVIHGPARSVRINGEALTPRDEKVVLTGKPLKVSVLG